jgi:RHS repeat-associated protein
MNFLNLPGLGRACVFVVLASLAASASRADTTISDWQGQAPVAAQNLTTLGTELFGDQQNLYNGALEFVHTDAELPGNNALRVAVTRRHTGGRNRQIRGALNDWDLDVPRIAGVFPQKDGWKASDGSTFRCSRFSKPPYTTTIISDGGSPFDAVNPNPSDSKPSPLPTGNAQSSKAGAATDSYPKVPTTVYWYQNEFWHGHFLHIPGAGGKEILKRNTADSQVPTDSQSYPLVTKDGWQLRCLTTVQNGTGEGFIALSPEGVQYRFDWMATRNHTVVSSSGVGLPKVEVNLYATLVTDRFGNTVRYTYSGVNPTRIEASDGRVITLAYGGNGRVASVFDGSRTWAYAYDAQGDLATVTRPDGSKWQFGLRGLVHPYPWELGELATCDSAGTYPDATLTGTITHPSGAVGTFAAKYIGHGRVNVTRYCINKTGKPLDPIYPYWPRGTSSLTLISKSIAGPGLPTPLTWRYTYGGSPSAWAPCSTCPATKQVQVTDPRGHVTQYTFGIMWKVNEGQLLRVDKGWSGTSAVSSEQISYAPSGPWPEPAGVSVNDSADHLASRHRPESQRTTTQQGTNFTWLANGFDGRARPTSVTRSSNLGHSNLGHSKTETTTYHDNTAKWVLGQAASVTTNGVVQEATTFDATTAMPTARYAFGLLLESYSYHGDGNLYQRFDPANRATTHTNYMRGIAQHIAHPDGTAETGTVNGLGQVTSATNAAGTTTYYGYDAMGRLAAVSHPGEVWGGYHATTQSFEQIGWDEYGLGAGHWRQTTATGNARTVRYFDALWRERVAHTYDLANPGATGSATETRYDADGRKVFAGYAQRSPSPINSALPGAAWAHDALGRVIGEYRDSELGVLTSTTEYLGSFQKRVTNARGQASVFAFQAFDTPSEDAITNVWAPEGVSLGIWRDVFGKPTAIARSGGGVSATRNYVYDAHQRLCKTIEPESGATVQEYDAANNVAWRASGLSLPGATCDQGSVPANRQISYAYDARNRLTSTSYGDGSAGIGRSYTADGLLSQTWSAGSTWTYQYNNRRLLTGQGLNVNGSTFGLGLGYDAHGSLASLVYPDGGTVVYSPDALGRPTQASGFASGVSYHPNGAIAGYTLANGIAHSTTQTARGLPAQWRDAGVVQDAYGYDQNGNTTSITDQQEGVNHRGLGYDGLDRLTVANGPWGAGSYSYDGLDNIRTSVIGARSLSHGYDGSNRLVSLSGSQNLSLGYDANGNVTQRGAQSFGFDIGNRLAWAASKASYGYDGHGRRTLVNYVDGSWKMQMYGGNGAAGQLLYGHHSSQGGTKHIYLGQRLIAEVTGGVVSFSHTDALGSPVARTNASAQVTSRTRYEAYGATAAGTNPTGIGFTGHVNDADTGLVYMQQRYYDPVAGRFLSVDPVSTDAKTGDSFNRYVYGNNNPYKFKDPDGRFAQFALLTPPGLVVAAVAVVGHYILPGREAREQSLGNLIRSESTSGGQQAGSLPPGTQGSSQGCIYCVSGTNTSSGRDYVGSTDNMGERAKDTSDGRNRQGAEVVGAYDKGDKQGRRNAEQQAINDRGGKDKLDNKRNEVVPKEWGDRGIKPPEKSN